MRNLPMKISHEGPLILICPMCKDMHMNLIPDMCSGITFLTFPRDQWVNCQETIEESEL